MAATNPSDIVGLAWDGDVEATAVTNAMAAESGYPAETADGELVSIVSKIPATTDEGHRLVDSCGCEYLVRDYDGKLVKVAEGAAPAADVELEPEVPAVEPTVEPTFDPAAEPTVEEQAPNTES